MTERVAGDDYERLTEDGGELRTVYDRTGHRCIGWVLPHNRFGRVRWEGRVEREFVSWQIFWRSWRRYRTKDRAVAAVNKVLDRIDWTKEAERV